MRFWNRWKLLGSYLARRESVSALPVESVGGYLPPGDNRKEWTPHVRRIGPDGRITTLATTSRQQKQRW